MGQKLATVSLLLLTLFSNSFQTSPSSARECPAYFNGNIAGNSCSREYFICVNGVRQAATCDQDFVFYESECISVEESPECQVEEDTEEEPYEQFDCSTKQDGLYALSCSNQFVNCVAGQAYRMNCPDDLVFNGKTQECQESCDDVEEDVVAPTAASQVYPDDSYEEDGSGSESETPDGEYEPQPTTEEPIDFDCNGLENGNYADGCSDVFYTCNNGVVFRRFCPQGTVFNPSQQACDYDCIEPVTTTTQRYEPTTTTQSTTIPQEDEPEYTQSPTSPDLDDVVTTTTTTTTTQAPIICQDGQVTSFGMCSSRFDRCQNNTVRSKQCPVNTLFESALVLCVFDLPQCQPVTVPSNPTYNTYGGGSLPSDTVVSPFDENVRLKPKFDRRPKYHPYRRPSHGNPSYGSPLLENPFFIPRHHSGSYRHRDHRRGYWRPAIQSPFSTSFRGRAALDDQFKDYRRVKMGKIQYGDARKVEGNKRFLIDDEFEGPKARFVQSDVQRIFPEDRHSKRVLGPREDPDGYKDDKTFDPKDLFGATRRKRSAYYGAPGYGQQNTQISARQAQVNKDCQQYTTPTFLTFGDCFDQFIYCSGNGVNRMAACPIGETFNKALRACSETCGVAVTVAPVVTATVGTQTADDSSSIYTGNDNSDNTYTTEAPSSYEAYTTTQSWDDQPATTTPTWDDQPATTTTTRAPVGDRCSSVPSGLFSLGCSPKYIQCSNGAAILRFCSGSLYFNQAKQACSFREEVAECGASTTYSPVVTVPADDQTTDSYGTPSDDSPATTRAPLGDRCAYVSSGLFAMGCSPKYIQCSHGAAIVRVCASSLFFSEESQTCNFRDQVPECSGSSTVAPGQDETTTAGYGYGASDGYGVSDDQGSTTSGYGGYGPSDDQSSTTSGYQTTSAPSEDQPTTYAPSVAPYKPSISEDQQDKPMDACTGLSDGTHGQGCSSSYIICSYGRLVNSITCPLGEGYDPSVQMCRTFSQIPAQACDQEETTTDAGLAQPLPYVTLEDVLSTTTTQAPTTTTVGYDSPSDDYTTTTSSYEAETPASDAPAQYGEQTTPAEDTTVVVVTDSYRANDDNEEQEDAGYEQKCSVGTRASTGFCVKTYLECTATGYVERSCRVGKLFDSHDNKCVPKIACGKEAIRDVIKDVLSSSPAPVKNRCANVEGEGSFALGSCSPRYVSCSYGAAKLQKCSGDQIFSTSTSACVARDSATECVQQQNPPVMSYYNNNEQSGFCDGKSDGLYRNEKECSAIFQCFGGSLFEHQSCPSNLAFNELTSKCDYPQKVRGCENHGRTEGVCTEHGAFIADVDNCSIFYRCVWGRKVVMRCPSGTVFNPALSVCDWPSAVPSCGSAPPAADDSNTSYDASSDNWGY